MNMLPSWNQWYYNDSSVSGRTADTILKVICIKTR